MPRERIKPEYLHKNCMNPTFQIPGQEGYYCINCGKDPLKERKEYFGTIVYPIPENKLLSFDDHMKQVREKGGLVAKVSQETLWGGEFGRKVSEAIREEEKKWKATRRPINP
ncbi:MAG: hypothetical protein KJ623_00100 [Nanoarchaeota archaeon]|nr:hypothetical protein [Nanoarchaeota archaeon]MBU0963291.1 hypothetical protein [Nanoarchaeota archaeon]